MTFSKIDKYEDSYNEDILQDFLNKNHQEYRLSDFLDINEYEDDFF